MRKTAALLLIVCTMLITGCALTDFFAGSDAQPAPVKPITPTYTPLPPTSGVPTFTPIPSYTPTTITPPPYPEITYDPTVIATLLPIPTYTQTPVTGVYQAFERGFMVYIEGANCLYAYSDWIIIPQELSSLEMGVYHYCVEFDALPDAPNNPPEGMFGRVWHRYAEMQERLGAPVDDVQRYSTVIPHSEPVIMGGVFYAGMMTLPDGRELYCGMRGATAGRCEVRG